MTIQEKLNKKQQITKRWAHGEYIDFRLYPHKKERSVTLYSKTNYERKTKHTAYRDYRKRCM